MKMQETPTTPEYAKFVIETECEERWQAWMESVTWFLLELESKDFEQLLVFDGGQPLSRWQDYCSGSYEIAKVALGLATYSGTDPELIKWKDSVFDYEKRMDADEFPKAYCLVRTGDSGRMTLFETNRSAIALYLHCFLYKKKDYDSVKAILAQIPTRLSIQSQ